MEEHPALNHYEMQLIKDFLILHPLKTELHFLKHLLQIARPSALFLKILRNLLDFIYSGTSTVAELSAESEYSVRHISRLYNEVYGIGAKNFIKMYRFQNVLAAIIADPERDNSFFIEGAGYSDQAHFQREFRTFMGMTPKNYIKLIKNF